MIKGDSLAPVSSLDDPNKSIAFYSRQVNTTEAQGTKSQQISTFHKLNKPTGKKVLLSIETKVRNFILFPETQLERSARGSGKMSPDLECYEYLQ